MIRIARFLVQIPLGTRPGLGTQICGEAPGDLWVEIVKTQWLAPGFPHENDQKLKSQNQIAVKKRQPWYAEIWLQCQYIYNPERCLYHLGKNARKTQQKKFLDLNIRRNYSKTKN